MNRAQKAIRRAVAGMLIEAETALGRRVYVNLKRPVWKEDLPCAIVSVLEERREIRDVSPRVYTCTPRLVVSIFVLAEPPPVGDPPREVSAEDLLADLGQQVEDVIAFDQCLLGTVADSVLTETLIADLDPIEEVEMSVGHLVYDLTRHQEAGEGGDPRALFDLEEVRLRWGPRGDDRAPVDEIELERPPSAPPPPGG